MKMRRIVATFPDYEDADADELTTLRHVVAKFGGQVRKVLGGEDENELRVGVVVPVKVAGQFKAMVDDVWELTDGGTEGEDEPAPKPKAAPPPKAKEAPKAKPQPKEQPKPTKKADKPKEEPPAESADERELFTPVDKLRGPKWGCAEVKAALKELGLQDPFSVACSQAYNLGRRFAFDPYKLAYMFMRDYKGTWPTDVGTMCKLPSVRFKLVYGEIRKRFGEKSMVAKIYKSQSQGFKDWGSK